MHISYWPTINPPKPHVALRDMRLRFTALALPCRNVITANISGVVVGYPSSGQERLYEHAKTNPGTD